MIFFAMQEKVSQKKSCFVREKSNAISISVGVRKYLAHKKGCGGNKPPNILSHYMPPIYNRTIVMDQKLQHINFCIKTAVLIAEYIKCQHVFALCM